MDRLERAGNRLAPHLAPDAARFVIPPGHCVHKQSALISKYCSFPIYASVMNHARVANRSPRNQDRHAPNRIIDHFSAVKRADGIGLGLAI